MLLRREVAVAEETERYFDIDDVGEEEQVEERKKAANLAHESEVKELREVLSSYGGRATIWRFLSYCGVNQVAPIEIEELSRFEGRRDVGLYLRNECFTSDRKAYNLMHMEAQERDEEK